MRKQRVLTEQNISEISEYLTPRQLARLERKQRKSTANEQSTHQKTERHHQNRVSYLKPLQAKTEAQAHLLMALEKYDQVLVYGPARYSVKHSVPLLLLHKNLLKENMIK